MEVSGSIMSMLHGLYVDATDELKLSLIGLPIKDGDGDIIGEITRVDIENDTWYGKIY